MSDDRVSYMYQRDPSIDRRYRPRPQKARNLDREIAEDDEGDSQHSLYSDTIDTSASVFLRLRPEKHACKYYTTENNILKVLPIENAATANKDMSEKHFEFSQIFHIDATQLDVYKQTVHGSIQNLESATILTYGTSGSGKTYTMYGSDDDAGIVQRAIAQIFTMDKKIISGIPAAKFDKGNFSILSEENMPAEKHLTAQYVRHETREKNLQLVEQIRAEHDFQPTESNWQFVFVWISFAEIYNENVYDLLKSSTSSASTATGAAAAAAAVAPPKRKNLKIIANDGNAYIKDLTSVYVASASDAYDVINSGLAQVNYASTNINANSSRSHCILTVNVIHFSYPYRYSLATYKFCDLAGSERLKKTENVGNRLKEAQRINTSLMVLGRCFDSMFQNQQSKSKEVVPFRESKLTMLLQRSLMGQEKITTIVTMAPKVDFLDENLQVLTFASIAHQIVYTQPKQKLQDRRAGRSTRFSLFMGGGGDRLDDDDYQTILAENAHLESQNSELLDEIVRYREIIQQNTRSEQQLRKQLVEEREEQLNTAKEKSRKHIEFIEKKYQTKITELENEVKRLRDQLYRKQSHADYHVIDDDDDDSDDQNEDGANYSTDDQEHESSATGSIEDIENRNMNGESFEKKRRIEKSSD